MSSFSNVPEEYLYDLLVHIGEIDPNFDRDKYVEHDDAEFDDDE